MLRFAMFSLILLAGALSAGAQTIVCFGDSLTAGRGAEPGNAYPDFLRKDLAATGYHVTIVNQGVSGDTTKDGLARLGDVLRAHPSIVILELGANDGLRGQPVTGMVHNLDTILRTLQAHHIRVLLVDMELPPNLGPDYVQPFNASFPALAAHYHVPLTPFLLQGVYGDDALMSDDGLHPNGAGYQRVAQTVLHALLPMLQK